MKLILIIYFFTIIIFLLPVPCRQEIVATVTTILSVSATTAKVLSDLWTKVINNPNATSAVRDISSSIGEIKEAMVMKKMAELYQLVGKIQETNEANFEAISSNLRAIPNYVKLEIRLSQLATYTDLIDGLNEHMENYAQGRGEFEKFTLENFASQVVSHNGDSVRNIVERVDRLVFRNRNDPGLFRLVEKSLKKQFLFQFCTFLPKMDKHGVAPDVIDKVPCKTIEVTYAGGIKVQMGNELTPTQVKDPPTVQWETEPGVFYLLCMTDPDAPSRKDPQFREWHHWLVGNISGCDVTKACIISEYIGSGPPKDTGLHRYIFLVYKQPKKLLFAETKLTNKSGDGRGKFSIKNFATKYRLGEPIAGNLFQAQWDDYVPTLYKQLGM